MHPILTVINDELTQLSTSLQSTPSNEPLNVAHSLWNCPGITRDEMMQIIDRLKSMISKRGTNELTSSEALIADYQRRLVFLRCNTISHIWGGDAGAAVSAFMLTMQGLQEALEHAMPEDQSLAQTIAEAVKDAKSATTRLRALEATISNLEPKSITLADMVSRIEKANATADQLPTDLATLKEARDLIKQLLVDVTSDRESVGKFTRDADADKQTLSSRVEEAEAIVALCSSAYTASTSHGLAAAFTERSRALAKSMWFWVAGLAVALYLGSSIGSTQLRSFSEVIKDPNSNVNVAIINLVLALLSVGATVWFSWLATKQIGQTFRLAEDYAFKASVSRAYEGYRREAANIDPEFVSRLFSSALSRLDEQPLRLVETASHGSPWHELGSSDIVRKAFESVPEFGASVTQLARDGFAALKPATKPVTAIKEAAGTE